MKDKSDDTFGSANREFEQHVLAVLQVQNFLITALARGQIGSMEKDEANKVIASLLREFSTLELPDNVRTDEATLQSISERHAAAQQILSQMLEFVRPR